MSILIHIYLLHHRSLLIFLLMIYS